MVVNEEIDSWYANSSYTNNELNTDATPINGDSFKEGITQIYFDNLTELYIREQKQQLILLLSII